MHRVLREKIIEACRQRRKEGDCPITPASGRETLEEALVETADELDEYKKVFGTLVRRGETVSDL